MMPQQHLKRGFTLIEILLGMGIFSLIALVLAGMLWGGIHLEASVRRMAHGTYEVQKAMRLMARDIENAVAIDLSKMNAMPMSLTGTKDRLTLLTRGSQGIVQVTYRVGTIDEGVRFVTRIGRHVSSLKELNINGSSMDHGKLLLREEVSFKDLVTGTKSDTAATEVLAAGVYPDDLVFSYGAMEDPNKPGPGLVFQENWAVTDNKLPAAVRVVFRARNVLTLARTVYLPTEYQSPGTVKPYPQGGTTIYKVRVRHLDSVKDTFTEK
ncbi:MAG: prepilin-type N-terminal cleavage/methylation domain-containing protein [Candidatus Omnitrophica bacterium]|nr:prepilin-type N-terminal cleavage/methylation domain-containing protein [Candidatus Omnitrophota bacterium]